MDRTSSKLATFFFITLFAAIVIVGLAMGVPRYGVWQAKMAGEAELAQAEQNRQVEVARAKAAAQAALYNKQKSITDAEAVAAANQIIGDSLRNNEAYLRFLYIQGLEHTQNQIVYIPTEAGLPILEAGRRALTPQAPTKN